MKVKVIDNFLNVEEHLKIKNEMESEYFPWYYNSKKISEIDNLYNFQFGHVFYNNNMINSDYFSILDNVIAKLKPLSLIRIKANLNPVSQELIQFNNHVDQEFPCKGALYYLNTNNGFTVFDNEKIESKANRIVLFNANQKHYGTNSTNCKNRMVINFNYF